MTQNAELGFKSTKSLSYFAIVGLVLILIIDSLMSVFTLAELTVPVSSPLEEDTGGFLSLWLLMIGLIALARLPLYLFTIVTFLIWLNRSYKNLPHLKSENGEFSSGWAVGWWFIPLANLVKPFQVVRELWNRSDPEFEPEYGFFTSLGGAPGFMGIWWALWIISNFAIRIGDNAFETRYKNEVPLLLGFFAVGAGLSAIAAFLLIKIIRGVVERQQLRNENLISLGHSDYQSPPPPPTFGQK